MKRLFVLLGAIAAVFAIVAASAFAGGGTGITATPVGTVHFGLSGGSDCTAKFVRSGSGIINETSRVCAPDAAPWAGTNVWIQFRPTTGPDGTSAPKANAAGDPANGTPIYTFTNWTSDPNDTGLNGDATHGYFINGVQYNVYVYAL
jgi:hypothetical protein